MTLQSSGPIKFSELQTEFGGSDPISLSEYYAGGSYVPSVTTGVNGNVPSSGALDMSKFYGTTAVVINIASENISAVRVGSGTAAASYVLAATGDINKNINGTTTDIGDWVTPKAQASNYEVYATLTAGSLSNGTLNTWQALTSDRFWNVQQATQGVRTATIELQIRKIGTTTVLDTATIDLEATREL